jgi:hypothetical protein
MALPNRDSHGRFVHGESQVNEPAMARVKERLREQVKRAVAHRLTLGIHEADGGKPKLDYHGNETGTPLVVVAAAHELGLGVTERSWLRSWFDNSRQRLEREMVAAMRAEFGGDHDAVRRQGETWQQELQEWIEAGDGGLTSLMPSTIAQKERAGLQQPETPLYATGELVAAIKAMLDGANV